MAEIKFTGFVDEWTKSNPQHPHWAMKVVEPHRKKNEQTGQWETVGRTWRTIKAAYGVEIDFRNFTKDDMVTIEGKEITESSERDGKTFYNLTVKAETVTHNAIISSGAAPQYAAPAVDDDMPF